MKSILLIVMIVFSLVGFSQTIDSIPKVDGEYQFSEVVILDSSFTKDILYKNAKVYFVDAYKSAKDVIQYDDKEEGKMIGKGFTNVSGGQAILLSYAKYDWKVSFSTEIIVKDGKYRYKIYNITIKETYQFSDGKDLPKTYDLTIDDMVFNGKKGSTKKAYRKGYSDICLQFSKTIEELKNYMKKYNSISKDDF